MQIVEAMEIMLLAVVSPEIRCEWRLEDWQVALVSTVSLYHGLCAMDNIHKTLLNFPQFIYYYYYY